MVLARVYPGDPHSASHNAERENQNALAEAVKDVLYTPMSLPDSQVAAALNSGALSKAAAQKLMGLDFFDTFATDSVSGIPKAPSGQDYIISSSGGEGAAGARVQNGYMIARPPTNGGALNAVYAGIDMGTGKVPNRLSATFTLETPTGFGIAIISNKEARILPGTDQWLHFEMHNDVPNNVSVFNLTYVDGLVGGAANLVNIVAGTMDAMTPGKDLTFKWEYDEKTSTLTMLLPGPVKEMLIKGASSVVDIHGSMVKVTDVAIKNTIGQFCMIEPGTLLDGTITSKFKSWGASNNTAGVPTHGITVSELMTSFAEFKAPDVAEQTKMLMADFTLPQLQTAPVVNITPLQLDLKKNTIYRIEGELYYDGVATLGMLPMLAVSGAAKQWGTYGVAGTKFDNAGIYGDINQYNINIDIPFEKLGTAGAGVPLRARITGVIQTNATTDAYLLTMGAQGLSYALDVIIRRGSWMKIIPYKG